jgi:DNA-binding transcriptional LysR family regulator
MNTFSLPPLNCLRAVEAVLRLGSLNAAASEIGVTTGAMSQQVIKAETTLGVQLFVRTPHGLVPTPIAKVIADHLHAGFKELELAVSLVRSKAINQVSVSAPPVFASKWLVWRLHRFYEKNQNLRLLVDATSKLVDVDGRDIEACIRVGKGNWPDVTAIKLAEIRVFPVCAPQWQERITCPQDLCEIPIIQDRSSMFDWNDWLIPNELDRSLLSGGPIYSDASLCLDAAIAGQGVFLAWEMLAYDAMERGRLIAPMPGRFPTGHSYWFIESKRRERSKSIQNFLDWLQSEINVTLKQQL